MGHKKSEKRAFEASVADENDPPKRIKLEGQSTASEERLQQRIKKLEKENREFRSAIWTSMVTNKPVRSATNIASVFRKLSDKKLAAVFSFLDVDSLANCKLVCSSWRENITHQQGKFAKRRFPSLVLYNDTTGFMQNVSCALFKGSKFPLPIKELNLHLELCAFNELVFKSDFKVTDSILSQLSKVVRSWQLRTLKFVDCDLTAVSKDRLVKFIKRCSPSLEVLCFRALDKYSVKKVTDEVVMAAGQLQKLVIAVGKRGQSASHLTAVTDRVLAGIVSRRLSQIVLNKCAITSDGIAQFVQAWQRSEKNSARECRLRPEVNLVAINCKSVMLDRVIDGCKRRRVPIESSVAGEPPSLVAVSPRASLIVQLHGRLEADKDEKPEVDSDDDNSVFHLDDSLNSNRSTLV